MFDRIMLKARGKAAFKRNYWKCVLVSLIAVVILSGSVTYSAGRNNTNSSNSSHSQVKEEIHQVLQNRNFGFALGGGVGFSILQIFVFSVLEVGCDKFYLRNAEEGTDVELGCLLDGFRSNYGKNVLTMFLIRLFTALWAILLVIPGIIKAYSYMLVPYILADTPDIPRRDAIRLSEDLMRGYKMDTFILDLSFIGWQILNALTAGLLGVFYVNPYVHATKAELYRTLRYRRGIEA